MKVNRSNVINFANAYNQNRSKISDSKEIGRTSDKIEISSLGKQLYEYKNDIGVNREEKLREIKEQVNNGTYSVDSGKLAKKILDDIENN